MRGGAGGVASFQEHGVEFVESVPVSGGVAAGDCAVGMKADAFVKDGSAQQVRPWIARAWRRISIQISCKITCQIGYRMDCQVAGPVAHAASCDDGAASSYEGYPTSCYEGTAASVCEGTAAPSYEGCPARSPDWLPYGRLTSQFVAESGCREGRVASFVFCMFFNSGFKGPSTMHKQYTRTKTHMINRRGFQNHFMRTNACCCQPCFGMLASIQELLSNKRSSTNTCLATPVLPRRSGRPPPHAWGRANKKVSKLSAPSQPHAR